MTETELEFNKEWESAHEGLQLTVTKRKELKATAREWFFRGVEYIQEKFESVLDEQ